MNFWDFLVQNLSEFEKLILCGDLKVLKIKNKKEWNEKIVLDGTKSYLIEKGEVYQKIRIKDLENENI
jgi:hypothetical protein